LEKFLNDARASGRLFMRGSSSEKLSSTTESGVAGLFKTWDVLIGVMDGTGITAESGSSSSEESMAITESGVDDLESLTRPLPKYVGGRDLAFSDLLLNGFGEIIA
jgi:hypothetical protein